MALTIQQLQSQINFLKNQLEEATQSNNETILSLKRRIHQQQQHIAQMQNRLAHQTQQIGNYQQKIKQIEAFLKERNNSFMEKQVKCLDLQNEIKNIAKAKNQQHENKINELIYVIKTQEAELKASFDDHQYFISESEAFKKQFQQIVVEKNLSADFNEELLKQIQELEETNISLIQKLELFSSQLKLQNQQSNDMLCQIEYMIDHSEKS